MKKKVHFILVIILVLLLAFILYIIFGYAGPTGEYTLLSGVEPVWDASSSEGCWVGQNEVLDNPGWLRIITGKVKEVRAHRNGKLVKSYVWKLSLPEDWDDNFPPDDLNDNYLPDNNPILQKANSGNAEAQLKLGMMYFVGQDVSQNYSEALKWLSKAEAQGLDEAQNNLGFMYQFGYGVKKNYKKAIQLYRKAVSQGNSGAQFHLGFMYENGKGLPKNYDEAVKFYRMSADQGFPAAQLNLGWMYKLGEGVSRDYIAAYMWFKLSSIGGMEEAKQPLDDLTYLMTNKQITEAERLVSDWLETNKQGGVGTLQDIINIKETGKKSKN